LLSVLVSILDLNCLFLFFFVSVLLLVWLTDRFTLVRYYALSFGESTVTKERWEYMKARESQRLGRLSCWVKK
jgi:hypothetical protein